MKEGFTERLCRVGVLPQRGQDGRAPCDRVGGGPKLLGIVCPGFHSTELS